jgi:hypothetical protein
MFYAAQVHRASSSAPFLLRGLQGDVERWATRLEKEEGEEEEEKRRRVAAGADDMTVPPAYERSSIVEL